MVINIAVVLVWIVVVTLVLAVIALGRQIGVLNRRLPPWGARSSDSHPRVGERAPSFDLLTIDGIRISSETQIPSASDTLLLFIAPGCTACADLAPAIRTIDRRGDVSVVLVSSSRPDSLRGYLSEYKLGAIPAIASEELGEMYNVNVTPFAAVIDEQGTLLGKGLVNSMEHLESLLLHRADGTEGSKEATGVR